MYDLNSFSTITIDASTKSTMQWQGPRKEALTAIARGKKILWHLDLGLFGNLSSPLSNAAQFMTLRLALDHFRDSIWEEFQKYSIGVALYQGTPDFSGSFPWDDEQKDNFQAWLCDNDYKEDVFLEKMFCRDVCSSYISQLAENVPDRIPLFLIFNQQGIEPFLQLLLTAQDLYQRFTILFLEKTKQDPHATLAVCWPLTDKKSLQDFKGLVEALNKLHQAGIPYKIISENNLNLEWHGLDHIIYSSVCTSPSGIRKLHGFNAAGGTLVGIDNLLGFSEEISFENFLALS